MLSPTKGIIKSGDLNKNSAISIKEGDKPYISNKEIVLREDDNLLNPKAPRGHQPITVPAQRLENYDSMKKVLSSVKYSDGKYEHPYNENRHSSLHITLEKGDITLEVNSNNSPQGLI